jgi:hypothetical protein
VRVAFAARFQAMATSGIPRTKWLWLSALALLGAAGGLLGLAYRAQGQAIQKLRAQALEQGLIIDAWTPVRKPLGAELRDVKLRFRAAPSISAVIDRAELGGAFTGEPKVAIDELTLRVSDEPTRIYQDWAAFPAWKGPALSWQSLNVEYEQREFGKVTLEDVRLEDANEKHIVRARVGKLGAYATFSDVLFWVGKRNQLLEIGFGDVPSRPAPAQLGYFASSGAAAQWMFTGRHQPVRPFARTLGWELGEAFEPTRAVTSASLIVPDDRARPKRASIELGIDAWPKPLWPDASALLGDTLAFAAYFPFPEDRAAPVLVPKVSVSLALFTLNGEGSMNWLKSPGFSFAVAGKLNCGQLRGNLSPSVYLDQVRKYLDPEPALSAVEAAARLKEEVELRLKLSADQADAAKRHAVWHLSAGCGMPELSYGS